LTSAPEPGASPLDDSWSSLAPWEKAAQWHAAAPHIADDIMALARERARHVWKLEVERTRHEQKMDRRMWATQLVFLVLAILGTAALVTILLIFPSWARSSAALVVISGGLIFVGVAFLLGRSIAKRRIASQKARLDYR
jgi:uncharacterized membrane protein